MHLPSHHRSTEAARHAAVRGPSPILIDRARNVGIRRARGEFILPTSPDILLSDELAEWFGKRQMGSGQMYRLARHDVPVKALDTTRASNG